MFTQCGQLYKWKYIDHKKPDTVDDSYFAIAGTTIQKVFEYFFNDKLYEKFDNAKDLKKYMFDLTAEVYEEELAKPGVYIKWEGRGYGSSHTKESRLKDIRSMLDPAYKVIKEHNLLGPQTESEKELSHYITPDLKIAGRADFLVETKEGYILLDGKATEKEDKEINVDQLYLYAWMVKETTGFLPVKMGFWKWRFSYILWVDINLDYLEQVKNKITTMSEKIIAGDYKVNPSPSHCKYCRYAPSCTEWQELSAKNKEKYAHAKEVDTTFLDNIFSGQKGNGKGPKITTL